MELLQKEFYTDIHARYGCFPRTLPLLCETAEEVRRDEEKREIFLRLHEMLKTPEVWDDEAPIPEGHTMLSAMAVLAYMPQMIEGLIADGFPRENAIATAKDVDAETMEAALGGGSPGMDRFLVKWFTKYLRRTVVRVGRLNFERCESFTGKLRVYGHADGSKTALAWNIPINARGGAVQEGEQEAFFAAGTEEGDLICGHRIADGLAEAAVTVLEKEDCRLLLRSGDPVIHIHIPAFEPFSPEIVAQAYEQAMPILRRGWPDLKPKALVCKSWMMDPVLKQMLPERSNLLAFQRPYMPFPSKGNITSALSCVFHSTPEDYSTLPEKTSLQRVMKAHYVAGGCVRFTYAYWLIDDFRKDLKL